MSLHSEIIEQPRRIQSLLFSQRKTVERIAAEIQKRDVRYVFLAARGTSDNAGRYANYLLGAMNGLPLALATPSLFTYYKQPPKLKNALVIGISQSGKSPDIVSVLEEGKRQGCPTLAITNDANSPLAQAADFVLDVQAGAERAVAATKTYTAELMAVAMLSAALRGTKKAWAELAKVPAWMEEALKQDDFIAQAAQRYRYMNQTVVLGRGFNYATAFEWALKLKELTYIIAEPYSSADFAHGPIAMVESGYPVFAV
ncbi:MAG: SIS domain-containing protein, partial [Chloroflexi bacterium]|nr:SIS domain-containing protein [Chloroflexota bacterium]